MQNPKGRLTMKVIDANGYYVTHVLIAQAHLAPEKRGEDSDNWVVYTEKGEVPYELKDGERYIDTPLPDFPRLCRPKWNDSEWIEGATDEELAIWKASDVEGL